RAPDGVLRRGAEGLRELPALGGKAAQAARARGLQEAPGRDAESDEGPERERFPRRGGIPRDRQGRAHPLSDSDAEGDARRAARSMKSGMPFTATYVTGSSARPYWTRDSTE